MYLRRSIFDKLDTLKQTKVSNWGDIDRLLSQLEIMQEPETSISGGADSSARFGRGVAFVTYDFGIDGVSMEISKYARIMESLLAGAVDDYVVHFISGDFTSKADTVIEPRWKRLLLANFNGWSKWDGGKWYEQLYLRDMPDGSPQSDILAAEIWSQALESAATLCDYLVENDIGLAVPVNTNSNPGNLASTIAIVLASELTGIYVLNSNHDFFWEGGKPPSERATDEEAGVRDHFFRNWSNRPFFQLFQRILPWNGQRWIQVNINRPQSDTLVEKYGFPRDRVFEIGTSVADDFFIPYTREEKYCKRSRMAYVLSDGHPTIDPVAVDDHLDNLDRWMGNQSPLVCGSRAGLRLDISAPSAIYLLQPTRIIARKRIEEDWRLIEALFKYPPFRKEFDRVTNRTLTLHITGPVPIEHQADLEKILRAYQRFVHNLPADLGSRIFQAFSVGTEDHPALHENLLEKLYIQDIFKMADLVLFPSETEGRGLPIVESSAAGVPIVAARYYPEEVFSGVVGEHLEEHLQVQYIPFSKGDFSDEILQAITNCIFFHDRAAARIEHNRNAVADRYNTHAMQKHFAACLKALV